MKSSAWAAGYILASGLLLATPVGAQQGGPVVAWGSNSWGQCSVPYPNADFVAVAAGSHFSLGLKADGSVVAWGKNTYGQCSVPEPNTGFVAIAAGGNHCLGLKADGSLVGWGGETFPGAVPQPGCCFVAIAASRPDQYSGSSAALRAEGGIAACGDWCNAWPQGAPGLVDIASGCCHLLGLKADGSLITSECSYQRCNIPPPNAGFVAIAAGYYHDLALREDGSIAAWGSNFHGPCNVPAPNADFVALGGGGQHSLGIKSDGTVVAWGWNDYGQCNVPAPNARFVAVAGGEAHSLGLRAFTCGDLDSDGDVDLDDYPLFLAAFGHCLGEPEYRSKADCDQDGCTTLRDYRVWRDRFDEFGFDANLLPPLGAGDSNCDGVVDFRDIDSFVLALSNREAYELANPDCDYRHADCNNDERVDFADIIPFVAFLTGAP